MRKYLLVNDDGVFAPGLAALVNGVEGRADHGDRSPPGEKWNESSHYGESTAA